MNLRAEMPETAAFIDAMREAFGVQDINAAIRAGMGGVPGHFWAKENGREVGVKAVEFGTTVSAADMVLDIPKEEINADRNRRR